MVLIPCPHCGKKHRSEANIQNCKWTMEIFAALKNIDPPLPHGTKEGFEGIPENIQKNMWGIISEKVRARDKFTCQKCDKSEVHTVVVQDEAYAVQRPHEVHHIIPRIRGGSNHPKNLITLCHDCHSGTYYLSHSKKAFIKAIYDDKQTKIINY